MSCDSEWGVDCALHSDPKHNLGLAASNHSRLIASNEKQESLAKLAAIGLPIPATIGISLRAVHPLPAITESTPYVYLLCLTLYIVYEIYPPLHPPPPQTVLRNASRRHALANGRD